MHACGIQCSHRHSWAAYSWTNLSLPWSSKNGGRSDALPHIRPVPNYQCLYPVIPDGPAQLYQLEINMTPPDDFPQTLPSLTLQSMELGIALQCTQTSISHKTTIISMQYEGFLTWFHWITGDKITNILIEKLPGGYLLQCFPLSLFQQLPDVPTGNYLATYWWQDKHHQHKLQSWHQDHLGH